jgi:hypothetical protein
MHYVTTANMESLILSMIQRVSWYVSENETEFVQRVREASTIQQEEAAKECKRRLSKSKRRHAELDDLVKKLYEANATGKLNDRHFERLLAGYDEEQADLEATMTDLQGQIDAWSEDKLKTDRFIELVKRYTDFSELTTTMLNEFIEKVIVHEGVGRGASRRQRVDIHLNFIGNFEVPADIVTPMELEEQRRQQEEAEAHALELQERFQERNERYKAERRSFTARKRAGLLTPDETEAENRRLEKKKIYNKQYHEKRKATKPPKPPKPLSANEIIKRKYAGLPLTDDEYAIYRAWQDKKNEQARERREKQKAAIRAEDIANGAFIPMGMLPKAEPRIAANQ